MIRGSDKGGGSNSRLWCRRLQALEDYREHLQRPEEDISLLDCALLIAKHAHPQLVSLVEMIPGSNWCWCLWTH